MPCIKSRCYASSIRKQCSSWCLRLHINLIFSCQRNNDWKQNVEVDDSLSVWFMLIEKFQVSQFPAAGRAKWALKAPKWLRLLAFCQRLQPLLSTRNDSRPTWHKFLMTLSSRAPLWVGENCTRLEDLRWQGMLQHWRWWDMPREGWCLRMPRHGSAVTAPAYIGIHLSWQAITQVGDRLGCDSDQWLVVAAQDCHASGKCRLPTPHMPHGWHLFLSYIDGCGVFLVFPIVDCV